MKKKFVNIVHIVFRIELQGCAFVFSQCGQKHFIQSGDFDRDVAMSFISVKYLFLYFKYLSCFGVCLRARAFYKGESRIAESYFVNDHFQLIYFTITISFPPHFSERKKVVWINRCYFNLTFESVCGMFFWSNYLFWFWKLTMTKDYIKLTVPFYGKMWQNRGWKKSEKERDEAGLRQNRFFFRVSLLKIFRCIIISNFPECYLYNLIQVEWFFKYLQHQC